MDTLYHNLTELYLTVLKARTVLLIKPSFRKLKTHYLSLRD
jgi:hypothetical protein